MLNKTTINKEKKSLKERFFLVIGIVFFLAYFGMGLLIIFWRNFPMNMPTNYRIALGLILILYSFLRFYRIIKDNKE
jgi:Kef-type K+ transport system membrane component KefB